METRAKRLAVAPLAYDEIDLKYYEMLVIEFNSEVAGVAAWDAGTRYTLPNGSGALFHGLYVLPILQRQGLGRKLMDAVFESAGQQQVSGMLFKAQRVSRGYFEHQGLELIPANEDDYPWQYWKRFN